MTGYYEFLVFFRDKDNIDRTAKCYGRYVNDVMNEFYYMNPGAYVKTVYKMMERDWGYQK